MAGGWVESGNLVFRESDFFSRGEALATATPTGVCSVCKKKSDKIIDARVRLSELGPKGHWEWLCSACHVIYGLGWESENVVVYCKYIKTWGEVIEVLTTAQDIRDAVDYFRGRTLVDEGNAVLLGQIAIQLIQLNEKLEKLIELQTPKKSYPEIERELTIAEILEGSNDAENNQDV